MKIRKLFTVESAHVVRNCTSHRCSHTIHGHSATIEVFLESYSLDRAGMVYDFGLMKSTIKEFVDSTDHCYLLWDKDREEFKDFITGSCDRYIVLPFNPSAENLSMFYMYYINHILDHTRMVNGEGGVRCIGVRYHETATGWAECTREDIDYIYNKYSVEDIEFSKGVIKDWSNDLMDIMFGSKIITNPEVQTQVSINN